MNTAVIKTPNGLPVKINMKHMKAHRDVLSLLPEAFNHIDDNVCEGKVFVTSIDFGRTIGNSGCVETTADDDVVYAYRPGRNHKSRCVRNCEGTPTSLVTVVFVRTPVRIKVITAWIGGAAPREPNDPTMSAAEREVSLQFWSNHALVI